MEVLRCLCIAYLVFACWGYCSAHRVPPPKADGDKPFGPGDHGENGGGVEGGSGSGSFEIPGSGIDVQVGIFGPGRGQHSGNGRGSSSPVAWFPIPGLGGGVSVSIVTEGESTCHDSCSACRECESQKNHSDHGNHKTGEVAGGQKRLMDGNNGVDAERERYGQLHMADAKAPESQVAGHGA